MSKEKRNYIKDIDQLKESVIKDINAIVKELIIPKELEYIEFPKEIHISNEDFACGVKENKIFVNNKFEHSEYDFIELTVEQLVSVLEQVEIYKNENY